MRRCKFCGTVVEPTGVEDVWQSVDSLDVRCPAGPADHVGDPNQPVSVFEL